MTPPRPVPRFGHGSRVPGWDDSVDLSKPPATTPDPATTPVPADLRREIDAAMAKYPDRRSAAIPALHAAQAVHGYCSPLAIDQVAAVMGVTPAYLTSVATFYDMLETDPRPKHDDVYVCTNISCSLLGADELFDAMVAAAAGDAHVHVSSFECLGACDIAPMASVNGEYVGPLTTEDPAQIIEDLRAGRPVLADKQIRYRLSVDPGANPEGPHEFTTPDHRRRTDRAGVGDLEAVTDRLGPSAPVERPPQPPTDGTDR
ncbi:MAG: NAD(P)H-dependent oxidoreductase subunit E [Solirubrobacterales bacterium]|nr:NAD(P)H-dependent oxidoreductase subunit E [Solirubrobacterales bacterium]